MNLFKSEEKIREGAIRELLKMGVKSREDLMRAKRKIAKKYQISIIRNSDILKIVGTGQVLLEQGNALFLRKIFRKRTVRTLSGIAPVAVLVKPFKCPGKCVYCPTEKNVPKSYLSNEPAVMRAIRNKYDPYQQVQMRLKALEANGHEPTKIELIVIGGTWSVLPTSYKYWFITNCFKAANEYGKKTQNSKLKISKPRNILFTEQRKNEKAKYKIIGITLETRPDYICENELWEMRELGCTRVELGVQVIDDKILKLNQRGHGVKEITKATKLLKDYGFKVTYHIMPGLPGSSPAKDLKMFKQLFTDERFQPDQIKFYPTVVTRGSLLYKWWRKGKYKPYSDAVLQKLITECKKAVPPYVRIIRLIRDIPAESIVAGNTITNLRQMMQDGGVKCRCIRCREVKDKNIRVASYELRVIKYRASGGDEYFISCESKDKKTLYGFCRLRLTTRNSQLITRNILRNAALIRELHVYGELVPIGGKKKIQHAGLGKMLMAEAGEIAKKKGFKKIAVIAGVGVRNYYRKLGYRQKDTYMIKNI